MFVFFPISKIIYFQKQLQSIIDVDFCVISHNHYDHLDIHTVRELGDSTMWIVPKKLGSWFEDLNVKNVVELDW